MAHIPVLPDEVIEGLALKEGQTVLDGTLGNGGHAKLIIPHIQPGGTYIGIDQDTDALEEAEKALSQLDATTILIEGNFRNMDTLLSDKGIESVDRILLDIGTRMDQLETSGRGFTFNSDEPLLMTFKKNPQSEDLTAYEIVNSWEEGSIQDILYGYGDERYARRIARAITSKRKKKPIETTGEFVKIIEEVVPMRYRKGKIHFATKTFQALRVTVNDEIESLRDGLMKGFELLSSGGRMAVISFHSTEDRVVKRYFRELYSQGLVERITKKPITPTEEEISQNRASRSSKLRIIKKV